jgi:hypothetical protein
VRFRDSGIGMHESLSGSPFRPGTRHSSPRTEGERGSGLRQMGIQGPENLRENVGAAHAALLLLLLSHLGRGCRLCLVRV